MATPCEHVAAIRDDWPPVAEPVCEECARSGNAGAWVSLRRCLTCGHVGCCDSSPNRHATKHFQATHHPVIKSFEPGEEWVYCYVDDLFVETL